MFLYLVSFTSYSPYMLPIHSHPHINEGITSTMTPIYEMFSLSNLETSYQCLRPLTKNPLIVLSSPLPPTPSCSSSSYYSYRFKCFLITLPPHLIPPTLPPPPLPPHSPQPSPSHPPLPLPEEDFI